MYRVPGSGVAVGTGIGSLAATGAGVAWWVVAGVVLLVAGLLLIRASRGRRAAADE
ncbi:LPXTG cell wall anchor domain-containing protein [Saccharothrix sp. S26]|uniref:LPXTG cell wall anchor domain-containing protein n=1 Tax=Saccharothrix sp. S26 TaxID=2907215 RepID=UPI001F367050|nr:LPXTG cell wall anchor domain-containing protein [Saccharothrix sp. S26]MCE6993385.1 LPXTG cell wall anchor domain-containing protein [Saccharothrix sp. S26]